MFSLHAYSTEEQFKNDAIVASILLIVFGFFFFIYFLQVVEVMYIRTTKKPLIVYTHWFPRKVKPYQRDLLIQNFTFYNRLKPKYQNYFEHRVVKFVKKYHFEGRGVDITDEMKILIAGVYVKLTFGQRHYFNRMFDSIVIYPDIYFSEISEQYHKGEFNPMKRCVIFSWKHFHEGISITNDNLNLGLHEFTHTLHIESKKIISFKTVLFKESLQSLFVILQNEDLKHKLIASGMLREYAYENQFEFVAVLLEHFFESPEPMKAQFPEIYTQVKRMINYNENHFIS
ncbi:zinc-dependent peptidase [Flavobacterium luminosum]|uniref:Zinc-dependent peptidase n=1 Tax=Flavobacterium luminosum TaxID=2949086 RepID=A0ABT0TKF6_9FLAO|nr:zinc-dependent peptidase [Flavobacterium sp. HXWNR70]MCL9807987.1 zinc-dependent peptidase [Flavobacterium sp. HXWNR70]